MTFLFSRSSAKSSSAFTLIELLIVISIIAMLAIMATIAWKNHINKARDAQRKADLERIRIAFEDYYSDQECYPDSDILTNCNGNQLSPYLSKIPCDPVDETPYCYIADADQPTCGQKYRLLSSLKNTSDPIINELGCDNEGFCGWETECNASTNNSGFNFGLSSFNVPVLNPNAPSPNPSPSPSTSPSPSPPPPGQYACDPNGICNYYSDTSTCGITFSDQPYCQSYCPSSTTQERCAY